MKPIVLITIALVVLAVYPVALKDRNTTSSGDSSLIGVSHCGAQTVVVRGPLAFRTYMAAMTAAFCRAHSGGVTSKVTHPRDSTRCTGQPVGVYGSSAMESFIVQAAEGFCQAQVDGSIGTPVAANAAIDVEYLDGGGCANGNTPTGSVTFNGLTFSKGCNDPQGGIYNCPSAGTHCYSQVEWDFSPPFLQGDSTTINDVNSIASGTDATRPAHANEEIWFIVSPSNCSTLGGTNSGGDCYMESGIKDGGPQSDCIVGECYFWNDLRPGDQQLNYHFIDHINPGDPGNPAFIYIYQTSTLNQFEIDTVTQTHRYTNFSTNNSMGTASVIQTGIELAGNAGAIIPLTDFILNQYSLINGSWQFETSTGNRNYIDPPLVGRWTLLPFPGNNGGDWNAGCPQTEC